MKDLKENSVEWTDWDSNRECLKFDKVGKHSSSTKTITASNYQSSISGKCTARIHIQIHHTRLPNSTGQTSFITGINFVTLFRVC